MKLEYARFVRETGVFVTLTFFIKFCKDRQNMSFEELVDAFRSDYADEAVQAGNIRIVKGDVMSEALGENADETELLMAMSAVLDRTFRSYACTKESLRIAEARIEACEALAERYRAALDMLEERVELLAERAANLELMICDNGSDGNKKYRIPPS